MLYLHVWYFLGGFDSQSNQTATSNNNHDVSMCNTQSDFPSNGEGWQRHLTFPL